MRSLTNGAQRASLRTRLATTVAASLFASVVVFGTSAAAPSRVSAATPPWQAVETFYLKLLNCTRTGGWVNGSGTCMRYGTGYYSAYVAPIKLSSGLSSVARSWAKKIATSGQCAHGDPGYRLRHAGYRATTWGENIGCWDLSSAYTSVLSAHRQMQAERSGNGGHWRNMKNARFRYVGIGVWRANGHTRVVTDFYRP